RPHHRDIHPGNRENAGTSERSGADRVSGAILPFCMAGEKWRQVPGDTDRSDARPSSTMRNAARFVEIEMTDIGTDAPGRTESHLGIEVGAVHVDLAAVVVNDPADLGDTFLEHSVRRRVG